MSPKRAAATRIVVTRQDNTRPVFDIMSENAQRDVELMIVDELRRHTGLVSAWELYGEPIHVPDVYQITTEMLNPASVLPGRWSRFVS